MYLPSADHFGRIVSRGHLVWRQAGDVAAFGRDRENLTADGDHRPAAGRRDVEGIDLVVHRLGLDLVFLFVGRNVDLDFSRAAGGDIEFPDPEVVFVDDHLSIARHRRPEHVAVGVSRHLNRLAALVRGSCRCC